MKSVPDPGREQLDTLHDLGIVDEVQVHEHQHTVVQGHHRVAAARALGLTRIGVKPPDFITTIRRFFASYREW